MLAVNSATVNFSLRRARALDKERTAEHDLAAGSTPSAFSLPEGEQLIRFFGLDVRKHESPEFPGGLPGTKTQLLQKRGGFPNFGRQ